MNAHLTNGSSADSEDAAILSLEGMNMSEQANKLVAAVLAGLVIIGAALFAVQPALADVAPISTIVFDATAH